MRGRVLEEEEFLRCVRFRVRHIERERERERADCSFLQSRAKYIREIVRRAGAREGKSLVDDDDDARHVTRVWNRNE